LPPSNGRDIFRKYSFIFKFHNAAPIFSIVSPFVTGSLFLHGSFYTSIRSSNNRYPQAYFNWMISLQTSYASKMFSKIRPSVWRPGFNPRPVHMVFVVDRVPLEQVFDQSFSLSATFQQWSTFIHSLIYDGHSVISVIVSAIK